MSQATRLIGGKKKVERTSQNGHEVKRKKEGASKTLGIIGRLGGIGARPERICLVSDADGAIAALACVAKLVDMASKGDRLAGDVLVATHICLDAALQHDPVPFMDSSMDAIIFIYISP
jgi:hypothetical protein